MLTDPHPGRATEIGGDGQNFFGWLALIDLMLRKGTSRADGEEFRRDPDKTREQQLFAIELGAKPRHGVKQLASETLAHARSVVQLGPQPLRHPLDLAGAAAEPLFRIPRSVKLAG